MSTTAEEALLRAKAIAARLSGTMDASASADATEPPSSILSNTTTKRKRWGVAPAIVTAAHEILPGLADAAKKAKTELTSSSSKKIWVRTTRERGAAHFKAYFATRLADLEAELNNGKTNDDGNDKIKLELKGRGASGKPALPGIPEEPMHILITGSDTVIAAADIPVDTLLTEAEQAPVEAVDQDEVNAMAASEQHSADNSMALTTIGSRFNSNSAYRPATVAQLISNNPIHNAMNSGDLIEENVNVPNGIVGFLIGRGGETISSMQARTGCKVQIQKEHELVPGQTNRVITLQATNQEAIDECRAMIENMIEDRIRAAGGGASSSMGGVGSKDVKVQEALAMGHALVQVEVPDADVGLIIGKSGSTIKAIQDQTGAQVQIPPSGFSDKSDTRTVSITHPTEEGANMAKRRIEDLLKSKPSFSHQEERKTAGPQITIQVMIPDRDVGLCIGRSGCVIKEMQQKTGTRIQIPSQPTPGQAHRIATVTGTQDGCNQVQALVERIVNEQSSACVMGGPPVQQNQFHQHYHGATVHENNSSEWQAYYAAQQVAQQQQAPAPVAASAAPAQAADAYYEQFFRYSYYYGEPAARQYYGAWSPPVGTPNPYGVNPSGITAAPAVAAATPAATPVQATIATAHQAPVHQATHQAPVHQATHPDARDTSVRKFSNLPAWMTQGN